MTRWATLAIALLFSAIAAIQYPTRHPARPATAGSRCSTARTSISGRATAPPPSRSRTARSSPSTRKTPRPSRPIWSPSSPTRTSSSAPSSGSATTPTAASSSASPIRRTSAARPATRSTSSTQRPDPTLGTGAIVRFAKVDPIKAGGKWNTYEITAKGPKFTLTLNGTKTVDGAEDADTRKARSRCSSASAR